MGQHNMKVVKAGLVDKAAIEKAITVKNQELAAEASRQGKTLSCSTLG